MESNFEQNTQERAVLVGLNADCFTQEQTANDESLRELEELLQTAQNGVYITELGGLHAGANVISGDFSLLARGFEVHGGQCVRAVEQITVAGNFFQMLKDIEAVGSDLKFRGSPVASPSLLLRGLMVAGE